MFISYAQNFEDVMLWRALKHVKEGFYIDVGAAWPESSSVTKAFYDRNWCGINIEPNPDMWRLLAANRPRDINLRLALSDRRGREDFYIVENAGLSTLMPGIVALHEASGLQAKTDRVEVSTLADVWRDNVGSRDVHFLKIDVEGAERQVLLGNNWSSCRPWIVVVEATLPMTQISNHESWEAIILQSNYQMAYHDGLNRFYVADEHRDILPAFSSPPNVFDSFVLASEVNAETRARLLIEERDRQVLIAAAERQKRAVLSARLQQCSDKNEALEAAFRKLIKSRWHRLGRRLGLVKSKAKVKSGKVGVRRTAEIDMLVERIYRLALHRNPSPSEIRQWTHQVLDGRMDIETLIQAIATSPDAKVTRPNGNVLPHMPNGRFIQLAYEALRGCGARADQIAHWDHILRCGLSDRTRIVSDLSAQEAAERAPTNDPTRIHLMGTDKKIGIAEWRERKNAIDGSVPRAAAKIFPSLELGNRSKVLVSAIASLYHGGEFIEQFLQNITSQTIFESYCELIIIDAASPSNESASIASYMQRFPNIVYHRTSTRIGIYEAWNLGIERARGLYVTNTNLDDIRRQDSFERQAEILEKFPFVDVVYQDFYYSFDAKVGFDEAARINARSSVPIVTPYNLLHFNSPHNAPMWRRALHRDVGLFDTSFKSAGDYDFWIRCVRAGKVFYKVNDPHVVYFVNPKGISTRPDTRGFEEGKRITREHARNIISPHLVSSDEEFLSELSTILGLSSTEPERDSPGWRYAAVQHALRRWSVASRPRASAMSSQ